MKRQEVTTGGGGVKVYHALFQKLVKNALIVVIYGLNLSFKM